MSGSATMTSEPSSLSGKTLVSAHERQTSVSKPFGTHVRARKSTISLRTTLSRTSTLLKSNVPDLDELKLSHILNGETCPPISFPDFASFITHKEFSTENLLFVIWFRSYRARYEALGKVKTQGVPVPSTRLGDRYTPFKYLDKAIAEGIVGTAASNYTQSGSLDRLPSLSNEAPLASLPGKGDWKPCNWAAQPGQTLGAACNCGDSEGHNRRRSFFALGGQTHEKTNMPDAETSEKKGILHGTMHPPLPPAGTVLLDTNEQPMRDEALRAFATFLQKGGSRELGIADELREFARVTLRRSCAPECFLPIYDEVYSVIENQSLPHFLGYAKTNINRPKQLFWYWVGFADFMIGVLLYLLPTLFMRQTSYQYRLARLPSILFAVFGAMQFYSAWRGFCNQVWGRRTRQVRPWEMDDMVDEEAALRADTAEAAFEPELETSLPDDSPTGGLEGGFFRDPFSFGAAGAAVDAKTREAAPAPTQPLPPVPMVERRGTFVFPTMRNESVGAHSLELGPDDDAPLPEGVHPLTDLGGHSPPPGDIPWAISFPQSEAAASPPVLEDELSPIALKQLQIRRATVKQPAAELAFPIFDPEAAPPSSSPVSAPMASARTTSRGSISHIALSSLTTARNRSIITPFDADDLLTPFTEKSLPEADLGAVPGAVPASPSPSARKKTTEELASGTTSDLSSLLRIFRRKEPLDKDAYRQSEETREGRVKVFGPEQLIVDPRVRKVMEGIVRDILVVGAAAGVVFSVLVFATPIAAVV